MLRSVLHVILVVAAIACSRPAPPPPPAEPPSPATLAPVPTEGRRGMLTGMGVDWVDAPATGDVAAQVREQWSKSQADGRALLLYVGAGWCEPCKIFHDAVVAGRFNGPADGLRLLVYDLDRDKDRLAAAGYTSDMIPLFAGTAPDGMATSRKLGGAVKGMEAIAYLTPRLQRLIASQRRMDAKVVQGLEGRRAPVPVEGPAAATVVVPLRPSTVAP